MFLPVLAVTALISLRAGDDAVLTRETDDPSIQLVETEGSATVVRVVIDTASRVVTLMPFEQRTIRLRDVFSDDALRGTEVHVEVLQGAGSVTINATELQPHAGGTVRHRAVAPPKELPTSFALIGQAEASGAINSETALLYRVYSLFSDARLPAQFRGNDKGITDSVYLAEVVHQYGTLSPSARAAVQPFLIPPAYQGSWANMKAGSPLALPPPPNPLTPCETSLFADHWKFVDATVPVRIHYRDDVASDQSYANGVAAEIDRIIWSKLVNFMYPGGAGTSFPLSDESHPCNGGNSRLDVYLIDSARSFTIPLDVCQPASSFITLTRGEDVAVVAHELFHTLQFSFPVRTCNFTLNNDKWWAEASANWAIDYVYGRDHQYEQASAYFVLNDPKVSIDYTNDKHEYGAYLLPFFQSHKGSADFVRQAWLNCATDEATAAIDKALSGGFEKVWPQFAKYNWNEPTFDYYKQWDGLVFGARPEEGGPLTIGVGTPQFSISLPYQLPPLSAIYHHFKFDENLSSVVFWNGVKFKLAKQESECCGPAYGVQEAPPDQVKGSHVDALINIDGTWKEEDWTDRKWVKLCRDNGAEKIDELVLIFSNSEFKDPNYRLKPPDLDPVLYASTMGCSGWEGTGTFTNNRADLNSTLRITATVDWRPSNIVGPDQPPGLLLYEATGSQSWTVTGECSGSGTLGIDAGFSALLTANFVPPESILSGTYGGYGLNARKEVTIQCPNFPNTKITLDPWFQPPIQPVVPGIPNARFVKVKPDGKHIDDSNHPNEDPNLTSAWHFEAKRN